MRGTAQSNRRMPPDEAVADKAGIASAVTFLQPDLRVSALGPVRARH